MGFMIAVKGGRSPEKVHETLEAAITEALRLQGSIVNQSSPVSDSPPRYCPEIRILQEVMTFPVRVKGQTLDYSALKVNDYSVKIAAYAVFSLFREMHKPL